MFNNLSAIYQKELRSYFSSPIAYIAIAMFLLIGGYFFYTVNIIYGQASLEYSFGNIVVILIFLMPLISMRLLAEEKKSGSLEVLLTRPIREWEIVAGKYLAAASLLLVMMLPTIIYGLILFRFSTPDLYPMITQYMGVYLVGLAIISLGIFASSLTENQIIAAAVAFTFTIIMWLLTWITQSLGPDNILSYFAISNHYDDLNRGIIDARDIVFYLSFILFWLYLTVKVIDIKRWA